MPRVALRHCRRIGRNNDAQRVPGERTPPGGWTSLGVCSTLCWVPVPIAFGLWLYAVGQRREYLHFAIVFLLVNLLGFAGYYIHPAAPPWYVAQYGFEPIMDTGGNVAGLAGFGEITGWKVFEGLYSRNANVFAAVPSLHSAYVLIAFIYSLRAKCPAWMRAALALISAGIWFTAVYTSHHYVIDVLLGIGVSFLGYVIFEYGLMRAETVRQLHVEIRFIYKPRTPLHKN